MPLHRCIIMEQMPLLDPEEATTTASSSIDGMVEGACFGEVARFWTEFRTRSFIAFWVDVVALGKTSQAFLVKRYCSTDCRCRCGAALENLTHSVSFHSREETAPPHSGIKRLVFRRARLLYRPVLRRA